MASAGGVKAGKAFVEMGIRDNTRKALRKISKRMRQFSVAARRGMLLVSGATLAVGAAMVGAAKKMAAVASKGLLIGAVLGAAMGAVLFRAAKKFAALGDALHKMSARTGVSAKSLSELRFAAQQSGTDLGTVEKAVKRMQGSILDL